MTRSGDGTSDSGSFLPDDWAVLAPLIDQVLDTPPHQRDAVLDAVSGGDPVRRAAIAKLVEECERDTPVLERPAAERFAKLINAEDEITIAETLGGRYRIEREIGRGGMARVYLAHDAKHGRDVAVKVIRPEFAASLGKDRFLREIAIAARLRHPNIVPVYDSGDADGLLYFVMPHEDGPSLRERIGQARPLSVSERLSILRDVARALAYAHEHGVVHRDIKPDNVMLSGGAAVVTDFGIAKAVSAAQTDGFATLTQTGAGIGTPAYMAPEQAIGDPSTDHRADIYSFGCLAYELFAGKPPFHGGTSHEVIAAHVAKTPELLSSRSADAPNALVELVEHCLAKNPSDRPQTATALLAALESSPSALAATPQAATPVASGTGGRAPAQARTLGAKRAIAALVALALVVSAGVYALRRPGATAGADSSGRPTLAVLPFLSINGDTVRRAISEGFSDELNSALFKNLPGLTVVSRSAMNKYRDQYNIDPPVVGRELGARFLLTGRVRWAGNDFTLSVTLSQAATGEVYLAEVFPRSDLDSRLREEIVDSIARVLRARAVIAAAAPVPHRLQHMPNKEAENAHLVGRNELRRRSVSVQTAVDEFARAATLDSLYPKAHSGLSIALALTPYFRPVTASQIADSATNAAHRAIRLDSTLGEPHVALALVAQHRYDWTTAQREYETALRLGNDGEAEPLIQYGRHLLFRGRVDEGLRQFRTAYQTEIGSAVLKSWIAYSHYLKGQQDSALAWSDSAYRTDSTNLTTLGYAALIHLRVNDTARAAAFARRGGRSPVYVYVLSAVRDTGEVRRRITQVDGPNGRLPLVHTFEAFNALGRRDAATALTSLDRATDDKEMWPSLQSVCDPVFDAIRGTARFATILGRVGLPELAAPSACPRVTTR